MASSAHGAHNGRRQTLLTLTTDFGMEDGNVGVMKGVILGLNPEATVVDLTHDIPPQDIGAAAYVLRRSFPYFPEGTIHVVVVDPGVGTERRPLAAQGSDMLFVAPDNGVLTYALDHLQAADDSIRIVHLTNPDYWLPDVSNVFHGRDIFAPVAAHLSLGVSMDDLGPDIDDPVTLPPPPLHQEPGRIAGQVLHVDHFGNLLTNVPGSLVTQLGQQPVIRVGSTEIVGLSKTFGRGSPGEAVAYIDSSGHLAIAVVNGSAHRQLECGAGHPVEVVVT